MEMNKISNNNFVDKTEEDKMDVVQNNIFPNETEEDIAITIEP